MPTGRRSGGTNTSAARVVPPVAVDRDVPGVDRLESGEDAQQRGLARAVRSEDGHDLLADREIDGEVERAEPAPDAAVEDHRRDHRPMPNQRSRRLTSTTIDTASSTRLSAIAAAGCVSSRR